MTDYDQDPTLGGVLSVVGGLLVVVYLAGKELTRGHGLSWLAVAGLDPSTTYHLLESIPVALMLAGLALVGKSRWVPGSPIERAGYAITIGSLLGTVLAHSVEHLGRSLTLAPFGGGNLWMWAYYLSWFGVSVGVTLIGVAVLTEPADRLGKVGLLVWTLPTCFASGVLLTLGGGHAFGNGFRVPIGLACIVLGYAVVRGTWPPISGDHVVGEGTQHAGAGED